jgi:hypothetical protein
MARPKQWKVGEKHSCRRKITRDFKRKLAGPGQLSLRFRVFGKFLQDYRIGRIKGFVAESVVHVSKVGLSHDLKVL